MNDKFDDGFKLAFEKVLKYEGGYSNDPDDLGGETKYGITKEVARNTGYEGNMKNLNKEIASQIYYNRFWTRYNYNKIEDVSVAVESFEQAVNLGPNTANKNLQEACSLLREDAISVDGIIGPQTLETVNNLEYQDELLKLLNLLQGEEYIKIVRSNESQKKFLRGWLKRVEIEDGINEGSNKEELKKKKDQIKFLKILIAFLSGGILTILELFI
jgi:lysozyme family protein